MKDLMTEKETADLIGLSVKSLHHARYYGEGACASLPFYRLGRAIRYKLEDVQAWIEKHRVHPEDLGGAA